MKGLLTRCIDPVMKCHQKCAWEYREYEDEENLQEFKKEFESH